MSNNEDDTVVEIFTGATLALVGGSALVVPVFGFLPLAATLGGIATLAAVGRVVRLYRVGGKPPMPIERSKRKRNS